MSFWRDFWSDHVGWPDANNDEGAPMPGRDWAFTGMILYSIVTTILLLVCWL